MGAPPDAFAAGLAADLPASADLCFKSVGFEASGFAFTLDAATGEDTFLLCAMFLSHSIVHATHRFSDNRSCDIDGTKAPSNRLTTVHTRTQSRSTQPKH